MSPPLITASELAEAVDSRLPPRLLDCRARLGDPDAGHTLWWEAHLPGSYHLDLDRDLAGPPGQGGRHPLPSREAFTATLQRLGITPEVPVVLYDDMGGQLAAARAWWMLACWAGHPEVRVFDGGIKAWLGAGEELSEGDRAAPPASRWVPEFRDDQWVDAVGLQASGALLVDARSRERFRGEVEPIDPVAGHIPAAVCRPSADNLTPFGRFKSAAELARELPEAEAVIAYCGSGVTACHNILAYAVAGRPLPRLYPGSWSEWIRDPSRPLATGE
ncbi:MULTISPECIES: sulfurtransferase [Halomonas]|uniref:sulfurtransferase n=1 Tax=Halomonas TaxID=2745 RepID=UPI001473184D|nr:MULTISPECIES: sulfurtransferase [Halomonas]QJQ98720.1 sulfurtransferase [Halomonas sp. PGE1]